MNTSKKIIITIFILLCGVVITIALNQFVNKDIESTPTLLTQQEEPKVLGIANPASTNCKNVGGDLIIQTMGNGGQYGLCMFEENRGCEEWALMRGDCPVGGRKTTGYDTIDQKYCAWRGGNTLAEENSVCTFKNGKQCPTIDYYNGKCSDTE